MCNFKHSREAHRWQKRAEEVHKTTGKDCDQVTRLIVKEMEAQGLTACKEFVTVYGTAEGAKHMCLEMYGKNCRPRNGRPVFKLNGYRIDGTAWSGKMTKIWKAEYSG